MKLQFSVIMPCYNSSLYVEAAINSVIGQSYTNWKLILINDGSTDDTLDIVNQYAKNDSRIKVYSKPNGGYVSAVNMGLEKITGDYFLLMGSDDQLSPSLFADIERRIIGELPDMIGFRALKVCNGQIFGKDEESDFADFSEKYDTTIKEYEECYPAQSNIFFVRDTAKCFKTSLLGDLRYFGKYGFDADGIFSTIYAHKCKSFMSIPIDGYLWTIRPDSLSAKTTPQIDIDRLGNWIRYYEVIETWGEQNIANYAKLYLRCLNAVGRSLTEKADRLDWKTVRLISKAQKCYTAAAHRFNLHGDYPSKPIKKFVFRNLPTLWTCLFRLKTRRF